MSNDKKQANLCQSSGSTCGEDEMQVIPPAPLFISPSTDGTVRHIKQSSAHVSLTQHTLQRGINVV